ncbi:MAG: thioredoxin [Opitutales bacterium]
MAKPVEVTTSTFQTDVLDSDGPVLVDFWAPWCGPCKAIAPILEELAQELGDQVQICKVNIDNNSAIASEYSIRAIPTILIFKDGAVAETLVGLTSKDDLKAKLV